MEDIEQKSTKEELEEAIEYHKQKIEEYEMELEKIPDCDYVEQKEIEYLIKDCKNELKELNYLYREFEE